MIRLIVATDPTGLIGVKRDGKHQIPWHYKQDLRRFKKVTMGGILIMGRVTFDSLPGVLPGRPHFVLTRDIFAEFPEGVSSFSDLSIALAAAEGHDVWICGGRQIYDLALDHGCVEEIDLTFVPAVDITEAETVSFDLGVLDDFELVSEERNPLDDRLLHRRFKCPL